jgi:hypothetical protein
MSMHRVGAKFMPRILTADKKQQRVNVCTELRQLASDYETFLSRVITGNETKQQPPSGKAPRPQGQTGEKQCQEHDHHFL